MNISYPESSKVMQKSCGGRWIMTNVDPSEAIRMINARRDKEKRIKNMSSIQRKRHQRQFAAVHFLLYGMEQFTGRPFSDDATSVESIVVVYEPQTKLAAECLHQQLQLLMPSSPGVDINLYSRDKLNQAGLSHFPPVNEYRIYIGDFKESKLISEHITDWKFNQFGFRYGWFGRNAVISFVRKPSCEEFGKMVYIAEAELTKVKPHIDMLTKLEGFFWDELSTAQKVAFVGGMAALALLGFGGVTATVTAHRSKDQNRSDDIRSDMLPDGRVENLSSAEINVLMGKTSNDELTDEEWAYMMEISPEYAEEWLDRDDDLRDMSLEVYDDLRDFSDYSGIDFDDVVEWKC